MRALPNNHVYNLFLFREIRDLLEFRNNRAYSIALGLVFCLFFWGIYLSVIFPLDDSLPLKPALSAAFLMMGGISLLALFLFVSAYQCLTLRRVNRSVEYEYHAPGGRKGWKKRFGDFLAVQMYLVVVTTPGGRITRKPPIWCFDLVGVNDLRIRIHPPGNRPFKDYEEEEAVAFAEKIARFMEIRVEKLAPQVDTEQNAG